MNLLLAALSLVFVIDVSASVHAPEYLLQKTAYVQILNDEQVISMIGDGQVAIVEFASWEKIVVDFTDPQTAAVQYAAAPRSQLLSTSTNVFVGIYTAAQMLKDRPTPRVIDISGDGRQNVLRRKNAAAFHAGWKWDTQERLNELGIMCNALILGDSGERIQAASFYTHVINGFMLQVEEPEDFARALKAKLLLEIARARETVG